MIHHGDLFTVLPTLAADSIDACVTDPPYGLEFMGKDWDAPWARADGIGGNSEQGFKEHTYADGSRALIPNYMGGTNPSCRNCGGTKRGNDRKSRKACRCDAPEFPNVTLSRMQAAQAWHERWAREVFRVLKPGAHLLAFGGTRTSHRMVCAIEDAGFEIRDSLCWLYGSGFPKSLNVSKAIDEIAPRNGMFTKFADHFAECRRVSGLTQKDIAAHFPSKTGGLTGCVWNWENAENVPTVDQWRILQPMLNMSDEWLPLIERVEAERQVIGKHSAPARSIYSDRQLSRDVNLTTSATDAAKQWDGWGTALKPAMEPIVLARKPLRGTVAANVLATGTGALNIDACRIEAPEGSVVKMAHSETGATRGYDGGLKGGNRTEPQTLGRWPSNVLLDESAAALLDAQSGECKTGAGGLTRTNHNSVAYVGPASSRDRLTIGYDDTGGASRFFYVAKPSREERDYGCENLTAKSGGEATDRIDGSAGVNSPRAGAGRTGGSRNHHPTVKPVELMRYLVRLITPPNGTVLDPFMGSGTTGMACRYELRQFIGIEREAEYVAIAERRIAACAPLFGDEGEQSA